MTGSARIQRVGIAWPAAAGLVLLAGCSPERKLPALPPPAAPPASQPAPQTAAQPASPQTAAVPVSEADLLFPWHPGDRWDMEAKSGGGTYQFALAATEEQTLGDRKVRFIEMKRDGVVVQSEGYSYDEAGVHRVAFGPEGKGRIEPPMTVLKLPLRRDSKWEWKGVFQSADGTVNGEAKFKLTGPESVKTQSGSFMGYRVDQTIKQTTADGAQETTNSQWFVPKIGLARQETITPDGTIVANLTKYAVGSLASANRPEEPGSRHPAEMPSPGAAGRRE